MVVNSYSVPNIFALLIGIDCYLPNTSRYRSVYPNLQGCVSDVLKMEEFLRVRLGLPKEHILKLTSTCGDMTGVAEPREQWPTYDNIIAAFKKLGEIAQGGDHVYIHYSGHGGRVKTPSRFQASKGGDGFDEVLVTLNPGDDVNSFLRDIELAHLLQGLVERELNVTIVLDSCHSGGATRGKGKRPSANRDGIAIRSIGTIDTNIPESDSLAGSAQDLIATWQALSRAGNRDMKLDDGGGWHLEPRGYVLLAACRTLEWAHEYSFDGIGKNGVLTYWLLDSLERFGVGVPFKLLYDRVLSKVQSDFPRQTPQLQGERDRIIFDSAQAVNHSSVTVLSVGEHGRLVTLDTGRAQGIDRGALLTIHPQREFDPSRTDRRIAIVEITDAGSTSSTALVTKWLHHRNIQQGDQAVVLSLGKDEASDMRRVIAIKDNSTNRSRSAVLKEIEVAVKRSQSFIRLAHSEQPADFFVAINNSNEFVICASDGEETPNLRPAINLAEPNASARVIQRLVQLAKYRNIQALNNSGSSSAISRCVQVALVRESESQSEELALAVEPIIRSKFTPTLRTDERTFLRIENNYTRTLNITILELRPNWSVSQIFPYGAAYYEPLGRDQIIRLPYRAELPPGYMEGISIIKFFATTTHCNFRWLELSALDQPHKKPGVWRGQAASKLETFLIDFISDSGNLRDAKIADSTSGDWFTRQIEVRLQRSSQDD